MNTVATSPALLQAIETADGGLWVSKSVLVREDGRLYRPVRERAAALGLTLVEETEYDDPAVMFGRIVEQRYARTAA